MHVCRVSISECSNRGATRRRTVVAHQNRRLMSESLFATYKGPDAHEVRILAPSNALVAQFSDTVAAVRGQRAARSDTLPLGGKSVIFELEVGSECNLDQSIKSPCLNLAVFDEHFKLLAAEQAARKLLGDRLKVGEICSSEPLRKAFEILASRPPEDRRMVTTIGSFLLHLVWLVGADAPYYAVFIEREIETEELRKAAERYGLTKREAEVLELIISGKSGNEIAKELCISLEPLTIISKACVGRLTLIAGRPC